jgi:hypothetical protein
MWHRIDPNYAYLINALKILNLTTLGHVDHPGTSVQWLGALVLKVSYLTTSSAHIIETVLANPETHIQRITLVIVWLNTGILLVAKLVGLSVFRNIPPNFRHRDFRHLALWLYPFYIFSHYEKQKQTRAVSAQGR